MEKSYLDQTKSGFSLWVKISVHKPSNDKYHKKWKNDNSSNFSSTEFRTVTGALQKMYPICIRHHIMTV